jgi:hypothetical protein
VLIPILVGITLIAGTGGWLLGLRDRRSPRLAMVWAGLPFLAYVAWGVPIATRALMGGHSREDAAWWVIGFGFVGLPMLVWVGVAAAGYLVGRLRDDAQNGAG